MSRYLQYKPGDEVPAEVVADANGNVATAGDLVQVAGENNELTEVSLNDAADGKAIGMLQSDADDFTGTQGDYAAGDSAGSSTVYLFHPVLYLDPGAYTATAGDLVQEAADGQVAAYTGATSAGVGTLTNSLGVDANGNLENSTTGGIDVNLADAIPFGQVFSTRIRSLHVGDRVAVVKFR